MSFASLVQSVQDSGIAEWMRTSVKAMPIVESIHVLAAATVFGTIFIVDLRLLGFPNLRRPFTRVSDELLKLTWGAFFTALVTGVLMFAANANTYYGNTAFRFKMAALLLAVLNVALFRLSVYRRIDDWDVDPVPPRRVRIVGVVSIILLALIITAGRMMAYQDYWFG